MPAWDPSSPARPEELAAVKRLVSYLATRSSDSPMDPMQDSLANPPIGEQTDSTGQVLDLISSPSIPQVKWDMSRPAAWVLQAVTAQPVFEPVFPTISGEPSTDAEAMPQYSRFHAPEPSVETLCEGFASPTKSGPNLEGSAIGEKRRMKHILASGLVIEVEVMGSISPAKSQTEPLNKPTSNTPVNIRTPSPEPPKEYDFRLGSDDSAIYVCAYPEEWINNPPRQGGDHFWEKQLEELESDRLKPFYERKMWRLDFIPTLLMFLGTRSNPWDWSGDTFVSLLRHVWSVVFGESSWADEDGDLVLAHASRSVTTWFDSFASNALATVEAFLKRLTSGSPSFADWSEMCKALMRDGRMFYKYPNGVSSSGLFDTPFVLAPLSGHLVAIRGGTRLTGYSSDGSGHPFGAIGLAAAAAFRAMLLFRAQLVRYDEGGNLVIKAPASDTRMIDTAFSKDTAGGRTRQCALFACNLTPDQLDDILSHANNLAGVLYPDDAVTDSDDESVNSGA